MVRCFRWDALGGVGEAGGGLRRVGWNGPITAPDPAGNPPGGLRPQTPSLDELALAGALRQQADSRCWLGWAYGARASSRAAHRDAPGRHRRHRIAHRVAAPSSPPPHRCRTTVTAPRRGGVITAAPSMSHHGHRGAHCRCGHPHTWRGHHSSVASTSSPSLDMAALHHLRGSPCRVRAASSRRRPPSHHPWTWPYCITFTARPVACESPRRGGDSHLATPAPGHPASPSRLALSRANHLVEPSRVDRLAAPARTHPRCLPPHLRPLIHPCHPHYAAPPLHPLGRHFTHWADAVSVLVGSCFCCLCCCCAQLFEFGSSRGLLRRLIVVAGPGRVKGAVSGRFAEGNNVASRSSALDPPRPGHQFLFSPPHPRNSVRGKASWPEVCCRVAVSCGAPGFLWCW